jgi:DNA-binding transcriptional MocR family regulator
LDTLAVPRARYKQVVDALAEQILSGERQPGSRLPAHRQLAAEHGLALVTASRVYAELGAMGLATGETGRGTFVREPSLPRGLGIDQHATAADLVDLNFNDAALPEQAGLLASGGDIDALLRYQPHGGRTHERAIVARHLARRGLQVDAASVAIVDGAQHGLAATAMTLLQPGDVVAIDALTYPGMKVLADSLHLELLAIPANGAGPDLDVLAHLCRRRRVRAVYLQPTLHNPLGWVMPLEQRIAVIALARQHGLLLIEDAPFAFLAEHAPPPLAALAPELTVYVSSLSKSIATGLRVGFVAASRDRIGRIERAIRATTWNTPGVMTAIACGWLEDGTAQRLENAKRQDAMLRQAVAAEVLQGHDIVSHPASYFLWLRLPEDCRADLVSRALLDRRIAVATAQPFSTTAQAPHAIRIALGSVDMATLRAALGTVRGVVEECAVR